MRSGAGRRLQEAGAALAVTSALAVFLFHVGTFHLGASALSLGVGAVLLLGFGVVGGRDFLDPLGLRSSGSRWWPALLWAFWLSVVLSWLLSPVGRAGEAIVLFLLPGLCAAAGIGRFLGSAAAARWGLAGVALVGVAASAWALAMQPLHEQGRAALPIGHHNQLALVLVAILPAAVLGAWRAAGPDRRRLRQGAALFVGAVLVWTLAATGSMSGLAALVVQVATFVVWILWRQRGRKLLVPLGAVLAVAAGLTLAVAWAGARLDVPGPLGRLGAVLRLEDPSLLARRTYAEAGLSGFAERPLFGWGPGSTSWTLANHWRPAPGVHPPGEVVTDAHSLLAQAPYELGLVGSALLLLLAGRYVRVRLGEVGPPLGHGPRRGEATLGAPTSPSASVTAAEQEEQASAPAAEPEPEPEPVRLLLRVRDPDLLSAALLGLTGAVVCLAFGVFAVVTAVPAVLILNLGLAAAARNPGPAGDRPVKPLSASSAGVSGSARAAGVPTASSGRPTSGVAAVRWRRGFQVACCLWLVGAAGWAWQRTSAARLYDLAVAGGTAGSGPAPAFAGAPADHEVPEVLARAAVADPSFPLYQVRSDPWAAAQAADGLAPLWLLAGVDPNLDAERRRLALERACDLDPLSALAPFELMRLEREAGGGAAAPHVAARAARAILAEPLLLAAVAFEGDPDLRAALHREIQSWPGLPPGWLAAFEEMWFGLDWSNGGEGPPLDVLSIDADGRPAVSFSLFAFRRPPWPLSIGAVPLRGHRLDFVVAHDLPAVTRLPETAPEPFWDRRCGLEHEDRPRP